MEIQQFLSACPLPAMCVDARGTIIFANAAAGHLLECGDVLGSAIKGLLPEWPLPFEVSQTFFQPVTGKKSVCQIGLIPWQSEMADPVRVVMIIPTATEPSAGLAVREANLRLRYVIEMLPQAICVFDAQDRYILWNEKYTELYADIADYLKPGIPFEEILKFSLAGDDMREMVADKDEWLRQRLRKFRQPVSREEQQLRDGRWLRHDDRRTPDGGAIGVRIDITELKQREEWLRQLFDANPMPMLLCDALSLAVIEANTAAVCFYGYAKDKLLSMRARDLHVEDEAEKFAALARDLEGDCEAKTVWRQQAADGKEHHVLIYVRFLYEGSDRRLLLTVADVSERIRAETEANRLASHDVLTGLPNRMQFYKALDAALMTGVSRKVLAIHYLDLDGFKPVNDTFGHSAGDEVLCMVADRLRQAAPDQMVARLGGDEFAVLQIGATQDVQQLAQRCISALEAPFSVRGFQIAIGVSIGIATSPRDGRQAEELVQAADHALYQAKSEGRNRWRRASGKIATAGKRRSQQQ